MHTGWSRLTRLALLLALVTVGCRTPQPDLKPGKAPEIFNPPPSSVVNNNSYPKQAFIDDSGKKPGLDPGKLQQAGSTMGMPSQGGSFGGPTPR